MIEGLRLPFFVVAVICLALAVLVELGSMLFVNSGHGQPPGLGVGSLALVDGTVLFMVLLMGLSLVIGQNLEARLQGIASVIFAIVVIILGIVLIFAAISLLLLMVGLLLAVPFGTIAYLIVFGSFPRGTASTFLGLILLLKIVFAVCLPLAQQRFLLMKGLIVLVLLSFVASIVVAFLQGLVPGILVSITDAIAAIVVGIVGVILAVVMLVFGIVAVLRAIAVGPNLPVGS
jgi:hypothetical protein